MWFACSCLLRVSGDTLHAGVGAIQDLGFEAGCLFMLPVSLVSAHVTARHHGVGFGAYLDTMT